MLLIGKLVVSLLAITFAVWLWMSIQWAKAVRLFTSGSAGAGQEAWEMAAAGVSSTSIHGTKAVLRHARTLARAASGLTEMGGKEDEIKFMVELTADEIKQIAESVEFHILKWPGYPASDKDEQVRLLHLRMILRMLMMEVSFHRGGD
tara:strand:- start:29 stop:472 length:444 start_codon:yes stop_codon:yes gene_type:complete